MSVISSDSLQLSHVKETVPGQTPATPVFKNWRTTGESLTFSPNTSESTELGGEGRTQRPANVVGTSVDGDINFELSVFPALQEAIAGVLASEWGHCPLTGANGGAIDNDNRITVGKALETFTIEKRFPNPDNVAGAMPITAVVTGVPGAAPDITFSGGAAVGSGVVVIDLAIDNGKVRRFHSFITAGDDETAVATAVATLLDAEVDIGATPTAGVVDLTTTGTEFTTLSVRTGKDEYYYQRYVGASYSVFNVTTAPNASVTGNVTVVGGVPELDYLPIEGATYQGAGSSPVFTAPEVIELNMGAGLGVLSACWSNLTINLDSQNRGIPCIGSTGDRETVTGLLAALVSGDVYFTSQEPLEALLSNEVIGNGSIVLTNSDNELYRFDLFSVRITAGELTAGGTGEDLTMPLEFQPSPVNVCDDGGGNNWTAGLIISTINVPPTLP